MKQSGRRQRSCGVLSVSPEQAAALGVKVPPRLSEPEHFLTPDEIGKIMDVSAVVVQQWIYRRRLPAVNVVNGGWKVRVPDFEAFLRPQYEIGRRPVLVFGAPEAEMVAVLRAVEQLGLKAILAQNRDDALRKCHAQQPALLVLGISAQDSECWKLAAGIRSAKGLRGPPILLVSNRDLSEADAERAARRGSRGFVKRPCAVETLVHEIQCALSRPV